MKMKGLAKPFFLAGGLTPDNVAQAIEKVESFAVDVASGVERLPTKKDFDKMKEFVRNARGL
jgi:phosphoribosylanthranilate isomerase